MGKINLFGFELTQAEINNILYFLEYNNEVYSCPKELTYEEWEKEFGIAKQLKTPLGIVKIGEHQFDKLYNKGRDSKFGMIKPTLTNPDIIVTSQSIKKDGKVYERDFSYVFIKSFVGTDGLRKYYFTSVTNKIDNIEISISNQEKQLGRIERLLKSGKLVYIKKATMPSTSANIAHGSQHTKRGGVTLNTNKQNKNGKIKKK